jgi:hypothetical protein
LYSRSGNAFVGGVTSELASTIRHRVRLPRDAKIEECLMEQTNTNQQTVDSATTDSESLDAITSQLLDILTKLESLIPDFEPHDKREIKRVAASAKFAHELIAPTVTFVTAVPSVPQGLFNIVLANDALAVRDQLRPLAQRLAAFTQGLEFTIDTKLAAAGEDALQTYHWAKRAALGPSGAALHPYLDEMRRVVKRAINRSKKPKNEPPPLQGQSFMAALPQHLTGDSAADDPGEADIDLPESYYRVAEDEP